MIDRLAAVEDEYSLLETSLGDPEVLSDPAQLRSISKRYKDLTPLVEAMRTFRARTADAETAKEFMNASAGDERELWRAEYTEAEADLEQLGDAIRTLMLPKDPNDGRAVIMEIRGAEGGEEANLFARDLFEMYQGWAARQGWKLEVLSSDPSDLGGLNQITFVVRGDTAWSHLKFEGGPHRVQRVPVTESQGRIHTSSATVMVLPEADEVDVDTRRARPRHRRVPQQRCRAVRASTRPTPPCASPTVPPASSSRCRTSAASCRTVPVPSRCSVPVCCS